MPASNGSAGFSADHPDDDSMACTVTTRPTRRNRRVGAVAGCVMTEVEPAPEPRHNQHVAMVRAATRRDAERVHAETQHRGLSGAVQLTGEHDSATAVAVTERIAADGSHQIVVDMSAVTFMDASTVGVLVGSRNRAGRGSRQSGKRRPEVAAVRSRSGGGRVPFRVGFAASAPSQGHRRIEPIPVVARLDDGWRSRASG